MEKIKNFIASVIAHIRCTLHCIWIFFPALLFIVASYYLFIVLTQGQDIIILVAEQWQFGLVSVVSVCIWSFTTWYSARLITYMLPKDDELLQKFYRNVPRLMALNCFISIQVAILALPTVELLLFKIRFNHDPHKAFITFILWYIALSNLIYLPFAYIVKKKNGRHRLLAWLSFVALFIANIFLWVYILYKCGHNDLPQKPEVTLAIPHVQRLAEVAILLFIFQLYVLYRILTRRIRMRPQNENSEIRIFKKFKVDTDGKNEKKTYRIFLSLYLFGVVCYLLSIRSLWFTNHIGTLCYMTLAFGVLTGIFNLFIFFSTKYKLNLFILYVTATVILGLYHNPYKVHLIERNTTDLKYDYRPKLDQYFHDWVYYRVKQGLIDTIKNDSLHHQYFDVYVELADGGASRSGYWVSSVLTAIQDHKWESGKDEFLNHLLSLSSASGGTVGNATFYSLISKDTSAKLYPRAKAFLKSDFFTYLMSHFLSADILGHWIPQKDRAGALADNMEQNEDSICSRAFRRPVSEYIDLTGKKPIFFFNTTEVQGGNPSVISSVELKSFSERLDVLELVEQTDSGKDIALSSAAIMSSRFPYISPAGEIGNHDFVDGGYFDNSGSGVTQEMMMKIDQVIKHAKGADSVVYSKLRFHLVHITNSPDNETVVDPLNPTVNNLAAPIITVLGTFVAQTDINDDRLINYFKSFNDSTHIIEKDICLYNGDTDEVGYSYNWVMSQYNLKRMDIRLKQVVDSFIKYGQYGFKKDDKNPY